MARATKAEIDRQLALIEGVIEQHPNGISQPEIAEAYRAAAESALDERTLQRRLKLLAQTEGDEDEALRHLRDAPPHRDQAFDEPLPCFPPGGE